MGQGLQNAPINKDDKDLQAGITDLENAAKAKNEDALFWLGVAAGGRANRPGRSAGGLRQAGL